MAFNLILLITLVPQVLSGDISFPFDYTVIKSNDSSFLFHYYYEIPYSKLFFLKQENQFVSRYQISLQIWNRNNLITGKSFTRELLAAKYEDTKSSNTFHTDSINLPFFLSSINNNKLLAKFKFVDLNANVTAHTQFAFNLPTLYSKLRFYKNQIPNPTKVYSTNMCTLQIYTEIYHPLVNSCSLFIYKILENKSLTGSRFSDNHIRGTRKSKSVIFREYCSFVEEARTQSKTILNFSHPLTDFLNVTSGYYEISIIGYDISNMPVLDCRDTFLIKNSFFHSDNEYFEMVNRLLYIATYEEMQKLKQVPSSQRESTWKAFWQQHNLIPITDNNETEQEYFERIEYCIKNFSKGDKGYKSDRAKIYMKYGPPDFIEMRPYEQFSNAYEIWYYYNIGKRFIFTDAHGFGEFILYEEKRI